MLRRRCSPATAVSLCLAATTQAIAAPARAQEPPNHPGVVTFDGSRVAVAYGGVEVFAGDIRGAAPVEFRALVDTVPDGAITRVLK